jgi:predicted metal-binding protein
MYENLVAPCFGRNRMEHVVHIIDILSCDGCSYSLILSVITAVRLISP